MSRLPAEIPGILSGRIIVISMFIIISISSIIIKDISRLSAEIPGVLLSLLLLLVSLLCFIIIII